MEDIKPINDEKGDILAAKLIVYQDEPRWWEPCF
jgi:hypothetical protein